MSCLERKKWARRIAVLLTVVMVLGSVPVFAEQVEGDENVIEIEASEDHQEQIEAEESEFDDTEKVEEPELGENSDFEDVLMEEQFIKTEIEAELLQEISFSDGDGSVENPYIITTVEQLKSISLDLTASYQLGSDLDLENAVWEPIGEEYEGELWDLNDDYLDEFDSSACFSGIFDGNGYTISNLNFEGSLYGGLFGYTYDAQIRNVSLVNVSNTSGGAGSLAYFTMRTTIENCSSDQVTLSGSDIGGMVANAWDSRLSQCIVTNANLQATSAAGGMVGYSTFSNYEGCIVSTGAASAYNVGGFIGKVDPGYWQWKDDKYRTAVKCSTDLQVEGYQAGGFIGYNDACSLYIDQCFAAGDVKGDYYAGGFLGGAYISDSTIKNSYATGTVTSVSGKNAGAFVGYVMDEYWKDSFVNCYASGALIASVSNFLGDGYSLMSGCYLLDEMGTSSDRGARTSEQMKQKSTYVGWDFENVWSIEEGVSYPKLQWEEDESNDILFSGDGTKENPYLIETVEQIKLIPELDEHYMIAHFRLTTDLDLEGYTWSGIGSNSVPFQGVFDGDGYVISNLIIDSQEDGGFFNVIKYASIKNLTVNSINGQAGGNVGGLAAVAQYSVIFNCRAENGAITGSLDAGGLVGKSTGIVMKWNSASIQTESTNGASGGLLGSMHDGCVYESYAEGDVIGNQQAGGFIGTVSVSSEAIIEDNYSWGDVSSAGQAQGTFIGQINELEFTRSDEVESSVVEITNCYSRGNLTSMTNQFIGDNFSGSLTSCYMLDSSIAGAQYQDVSGRILFPWFPITILQMMLKATYVDWDFDSVWYLDEPDTSAISFHAQSASPQSPTLLGQQSGVKKKKAIYVIPGYMGSELYYTTQDGNMSLKLWVHLGRRLAEEMNNFKYTGASAMANGEDGYGMKVDISDLDQYGTINIYKKIIQKLEREFRSEYDIHFYRYNWLGSLHDEAVRLQTVIDKDGYEEVSFVAHSTGGLLVADYLALNTQNRNKTKKAIMVGAPLYGTYIALEAVETGYHSLLENYGLNLLLFDIDEQTKTDYVKNFTKNARATYQLFPSKEYLALHPMKYYGGDITTMDGVYSILTKSENTNSKFINDHKDSHKKFREEMLTGQNTFTGIVALLWTVDTFLIGSSELLTLETPEYTFGDVNYVWTDTIATNDGDGTVHKTSGFAMNENGNPRLKSKDYKTIGHVDLISDAAVMNDIVSYIKNGQVEGQTAIGDELDAQTKSKTMESYLKLNIHSKEIVDIEIRDENGDVVATISNEGETFGFDKINYAYYVLQYDSEGMHVIVYLPTDGHTVTLVNNSAADNLFEAAGLEVKLSTLTPDGYNRTSVTFQQKTEGRKQFSRMPAGERTMMVFDLLEHVTDKTLEDMQAESMVQYEKSIEYCLTE